MLIFEITCICQVTWLEVGKYMFSLKMALFMGWLLWRNGLRCHLDYPYPIPGCLGLSPTAPLEAAFLLMCLRGST